MGFFCFFPVWFVFSKEAPEAAGATVTREKGKRRMWAPGISPERSVSLAEGRLRRPPGAEDAPGEPAAAAAFAPRHLPSGTFFLTF